MTRAEKGRSVFFGRREYKLVPIFCILGSSTILLLIENDDMSVCKFQTGSKIVCVGNFDRLDKF
jgi:hypothetical protein